MKLVVEFFLFVALCGCGKSAAKIWTAEEDARFMMAIEELGHSDWNAIATRVGTKNSKQCAYRWYKRSGVWTPVEDNALRTAVEELGTGNWDGVAARVQTKSSMQCLSHWHNHSYTRWTKAEDGILRTAVAELGTRWKNIAARVGTRNERQCRERWSNCLSHELTCNGWTAAEENILSSKFAELGSQWGQIATFLSGRTSSNVKTHHQLMMRRKGSARDAEPPLEELCDSVDIPELPDPFHLDPRDNPMDQFGIDIPELPDRFPLDWP
jgi:hypothetical protein